MPSLHCIPLSFTHYPILLSLSPPPLLSPSLTIGIVDTLIDGLRHGETKRREQDPAVMLSIDHQVHGPTHLCHHSLFVHVAAGVLWVDRN